MPDPFLTTARLTLREFTTADVDLVVELDGDPAVMRYITGGLPTTREEIEADYLPSWLACYAASPGYGLWAARERAAGAFLGWFHLWPPEDARGAEVGYRLRAAAWGRGYATEGARALIAHAFAQPGVERVYAETMAVNVASRRVMEKAGLRVARSFHQDWPYRIEGEEHGEVEYALTRAEWVAARG